MTIRLNAVVAAILVGLTGQALAQVPPAAAPDQMTLLESSDPKLAANKKLVFNMWREIIQGGQYTRVPHYFTEGYIQHSPNIATGRDSFQAFLRGSRPARPVADRIQFPVIAIIAEGDLVMVANARRYADPAKPGEKYTTTWFDMFRIEDGKIAEHWDAALKDSASLKLNPNLDR